MTLLASPHADGSWPTVRPFATGYSPFMMWTSVLQIVVVVTRTRAWSGPTSGTGLSSSAMRPGSTKIVTFIFLTVDSLRFLGPAGYAFMIRSRTPERTHLPAS